MVSRTQLMGAWESDPAFDRFIWSEFVWGLSAFGQFPHPDVFGPFGPIAGVVVIEAEFAG